MQLEINSTPSTKRRLKNAQAAFTGGSAVLPYTRGLTGLYAPTAAQGWAYTAYFYTDPAHAHAVTSLSSGDTFAYDANGNMTTRVEGGVTYTQNFDIENRLASVTVNSQTTTFVYDGDGNLVKKIKPDGTSTAYVGGVYEVELNAGGQITKKTSYYGVAMRVEVVGVSNTLYYMLRDHLGSASVTLDASGNVVANGEQRYYPFGESRIAGASLPTDRLYTGQRDTGLGLYHYGARFYLSKLGRFASADTVVPNPVNPQSLNRYAYVMNSPARYTDPTGHRTECGGTDAFISETTGDGGISEASCWARQRDEGIGRSVGMSEEVAEDFAAVVDIFGIGHKPNDLYRWLRSDPTNSNVDCSNLTYVECYEAQGYEPFARNEEIDKAQFEDLQQAVWKKLVDMGPIGPNDLNRGWFDTPFWNGPGQDEDTTICYEGNCYLRSEVNYFAQGMWGAASGQTLEEALATVQYYKQRYHDEDASEGVIFWTTFGYNRFNELQEASENGQP